MGGGEADGGLGAVAGTDRGALVVVPVELSEQGRRELRGVAVPLNNEAGVRCGGRALLAGGAGERGGGDGGEALVEKELGDVGLDGGAAEDGGGVAEVLDGEEGAVLLDDGDADGGELRAEQVGAVDRGLEPELRDGGGVGAGGAAKVFGDPAEVGSGLRGAGGEIGLTGVLVLERTQAGVRHVRGVLAGGESEGGIPGQRRQV